MSNAPTGKNPEELPSHGNPKVENQKYPPIEPKESSKPQPFNSEQPANPVEDNSSNPFKDIEAPTSHNVHKAGN